MQKSLCLSRFFSVLIISFSLFFIPSCQPELDDPGGGNPPPSGAVDDKVTVLAGVRGIVINENNQPVQGATVTSGAYSTTTDRYGVFRFNNINLSKNNAYIKVVRQGYFTGHRTFVASEGRIHNVRIRLLPKTNTGSFTASSGGTITLGTGGKLVMPANAVTDASGNAYTGSVNIAMTWIDPSAPNLPEIIVGDLRGITTNNEERGLATYGMLGLEMTGGGGEPLKIATGKTAELIFPIPASIAGRAPAIIDLWHFDETKGRWIQEGTAARSGNNYLAQVSHFSFWNCDAPFPLVNLCMTVLNAANSQPLINVEVRIVRSDGSYSSGRTDSTGNLCGKIPKNEALTLQVMDQCHNAIYSQSIGPFSADASLGNISVNLPGPNNLTITGNVTNCANTAVTNGVVVIYTDNANSYSVPVTNGSFSFTLIRCSGSTMNFAVKAVDLSTFRESVMYNGMGTSGNVSTGTLQACANPDEFIEYIIDGIPYTWMDLGQPNIIQTMDSVASNGFATKTVVYGQFVTNGTMETTHFRFYHNETPGTYPMDAVPSNIKVSNPAETIPRLTIIVTPNPMITITAIGPAGTGYIEGNFNIMAKNHQTNIVQNVICTFRAKR